MFHSHYSPCSTTTIQHINYNFCKIWQDSVFYEYEFKSKSSPSGYGEGLWTLGSDI